jgi:GT2 family glycosyltransferase
VSAPVVSVVVVTYTRPDLLEACLESLIEARRRAPESELIVVDNGSGLGARSLVERLHSDATVIELAENIGFAGAVDRGIDATRGEWIALFNDDTSLEPEALDLLVAAGRGDERAGSVAAQIRFAGQPGLLNSAGIVIDGLGNNSDRLLGQPLQDSEAELTEVFGAAGTAAVYRRATLEGVGGFDATFYAHLEDADVAWRARMLGWSCLYEPRAVVHHHHAATLNHFSEEKYFVGGRNRVRLLAKNADRRMLWRAGAAIVAYDLAYVGYVAARERTLAPLRGRLAGLREWRRYRRAGADLRRPLRLPRSSGLRGALRRRAVWSRNTAARQSSGSTGSSG